jgi:archaellum component FlaC
MSDIVSDLKQVEQSLSTMSSDVHDIGKDYPDAKSKLYSLENDIERLLSDVKRIREKIKTGGDQN